MPRPDAKLPPWTARAGYVFRCHTCGTQLSDCDDVVFVDGAPHCMGSCVSFDIALPYRPRSITGTRVRVGAKNVYATAIRFDYSLVAATIRIRTNDPAEHKPAAGKRARVAWIREVVAGRPITKGQGVLFA